jgi:predicted phosphate transport protein (TIGR00153 family)
MLGSGGMKEVLAVAAVHIGGKKEREALDILKRNAGMVANVVKKFEDLITVFFSERDLKKAEAFGRELSGLETKADEGRREFLRILNEGAFLPAFRGDLARLADRLDKVADTAEGAMRAMLLRGKLINVFREVERKSSKVKELKPRLLGMAELTTKTVDTLKRAVEELTIDIDSALKKVQEVNELEHEIDLVQQGLLSDLYECEKYFDPISVMQLKDILDRFENISDRAEDASDVIEIIASTFRA